MYGVLGAAEPNDDLSTASLQGARHQAMVQSSPPPFSMAPPPAGEFATRDALLAFQKEWAESQGFAVVIGRSRPNRLWIKCDRGGEYADKHLHDPENRKRKRKATRLTGCPFNVKATMRKDKIWRCHTETPEHNHPPSEDLTVHPSLRRMTDEQLQLVNDMTDGGHTPAETLDALQSRWPGIKVLRRDIYNARKKFKTDKEVAEIAQGLHVPQPYEDPNGKMPGPTRTGRWEWLEEGDEIRRRRKKRSSAANAAAAAAAAATAAAAVAVDVDPASTLAPELRDSSILLSSHDLRAATGRDKTLGANGGRSLASTTALLHATPGTGTPSTWEIDQSASLQPHLSSTSSSAMSNGANSRFRHYQPAQTSTSNAPSRAIFASSTAPSRPPSAVAGTAANQQATSMAPSSNLRGRAAQEPAPVAPMVTDAAATTSGPNPMPATRNAKAPSGQVLMSRIERMEKEQTEQKQMLAQILNAVQAGSLRR